MRVSCQLSAFGYRNAYGAQITMAGRGYFAVGISQRVRRDVRAWANRRGFEIHRISAEVEEPLGPVVADVYSRVSAYTRLPPLTVAAIVEAVEYVVARDIEGDIVECGVWRGGSMMAAALTLRRLGVQRDLRLFDTYEGMTKPTEWDTNNNSGGLSELDAWEQTKGASGRASAVSVGDVRTAMASTGYDMDRVRFIKGPVEDTLPDHAPDQIALLRLDTDYYESTRHELVHLFPRLTERGVLIVDDYGMYEGARKAVDEYFGDRRPLLAPTDPGARMSVKA